MNTKPKDTTKQPTPQPLTPVIVALLAACGDSVCHWVSSAGQDRTTDLTEVCGGSGYWSRPVKEAR